MQRKLLVIFILFISSVAVFANGSKEREPVERPSGRAVAGYVADGATGIAIGTAVVSALEVTTVAGSVGVGAAVVAADATLYAVTGKSAGDYVVAGIITSSTKTADAIVSGKRKPWRFSPVK